jgi:hypothetical protein
MTNELKIEGLTHDQDAICPVCGKPTKADLFANPLWLLTEGHQDFDPVMITCIDCKIKKGGK